MGIRSPLCRTSRRGRPAGVLGFGRYALAIRQMEMLGSELGCSLNEKNVNFFIIFLSLRQQYVFPG